MFSAATPVKKPHTRASAAIRRSQSRASSIGLAGGTATPPPPQLQSTSTLTVPGPSRRAGKGPSSVTPTLSVLGGASAYAASDYAKDAVEYSDIDVLESQGVLLKTETHTVSLYGSSLPAEVQAALSSTGGCFTADWAVKRLHAPMLSSYIHLLPIPNDRLLHRSLHGPHRSPSWVRLPRRARARLRVVPVKGARCSRAFLLACSCCLCRPIVLPRLTESCRPLTLHSPARTPRPASPFHSLKLQASHLQRPSSRQSPSYVSSLKEAQSNLESCSSRPQVSCASGTGSAQPCPVSIHSPKRIYP